jgi:hypothetical protein
MMEDDLLADGGLWQLGLKPKLTWPERNKAGGKSWTFIAVSMTQTSPMVSLSKPSSMVNR